MRTITALLLAAAVLTACTNSGPPEPVAADPCDDAISAARDHEDALMEAQERATEASYPASADHEREYRSEARLWAQVVNGNEECFTAEERAVAAEVLVKFTDS